MPINIVTLFALSTLIISEVMRDPVLKIFQGSAQILLPWQYTIYRCLRRVLGISWNEHVPNQEIYDRTGQLPLPIILRRKRMPPTTGTTTPRQAANAMERLGVSSAVSFEEAVNAAQDKRGLRRFVAALCGFSPRRH